MNIVCISTIQWDELWQRHHEFMSRFAGDGARVFFLENMGFRKVKWSDMRRILQRIKRIFLRTDGRFRNNIPKNLYVVTPLVLPPGSFFRFINRKWLIPRLLKRLDNIGCHSVDLAFVYLPAWSTLDLLEYLNSRITVFDCVANFAGHPDCPPDFSIIESKLLESCDLVLTDSSYLTDLMSQKHENVVQLHHGVSTELFGNRPEDFPKNYRSICFFGTIDDRIDWSVVQELRASGVEVYLVGAQKTAVMDGVHVLGPFSKESLYYKLREFDAFFIPYKVSEFTSGIVPAKIYECLATTKPVLVSPLPYTSQLADLVYVCSTPEEFVSTFKALPSTETIRKRNMRLDVAQSQDCGKAYEVLKKSLHTVVDATNST